jgi:hypothetical protein
MSGSTLGIYPARTNGNSGMTNNPPSAEDTIGTIVGIQSGCVVVELGTGELVLCRSLTRLHRPLGFFTVPYGRCAKISCTKGADRMPLLVEVLKD